MVDLHKILYNKIKLILSQSQCHPFSQGMWGPKFRGKTSDIRLKEWEANPKTMFRMYNMSESTQVNMAFSCLEGEAKRHI